MAKILDLQAEPRTQSGTGAVKRMRKAGNIPAALYGRKVKASNIQVHGKTFSKLLESSASDNILVSLKIAGSSKTSSPSCRKCSTTTSSGGILHIDFHAVAADEEIHANVPVVMVGEAKGQKLGGMVEAIHHEIEVRCLPKDLPESIRSTSPSSRLARAFTSAKSISPKASSAASVVMSSSSCAKSPRWRLSPLLLPPPPPRLPLVPPPLRLLAPLLPPQPSLPPRSNPRTFSTMWLPARKQRAAA
jgi:ribosomal protein bL25 (Ctc-form)